MFEIIRIYSESVVTECYRTTIEFKRGEMSQSRSSVRAFPSQSWLNATVPQLNLNAGKCLKAVPACEHFIKSNHRVMSYMIS